MDTWLLTCTGSQVAPLSVLEKISRGVMVNNVFGGPTVMARLWMSGSVTPLVTTSHVLPPSLLCRTPSTSRPAQMCWWSTGSTTRAVTLGVVRHRALAHWVAQPSKTASAKPCRAVALTAEGHHAERRPTCAQPNKSIVGGRIPDRAKSVGAEAHDTEAPGEPRPRATS